MNKLFHIVCPYCGKHMEIGSEKIDIFRKPLFGINIEVFYCDCPNGKKLNPTIEVSK